MMHPGLQAEGQAARVLLPVQPLPPWYAIRKAKQVPCSLLWKISPLVLEIQKQASGDMAGDILREIPVEEN